MLNVEKAHKASKDHRQQVEKSDKCGCFFCLNIFNPSEILEWVDDNKTAVCPNCGTDAVVASASGFEIITDFLKRMNKRWFHQGPAR